MKYKHKKGLFLFLLTVTMLLFLTACGKGREADTNEYAIYCLDRDENSLDTFIWRCDTVETNEIIAQMLDIMAKVPDDVKLKQPVNGFSVVNYKIADGQIAVEVSEEYHSLQATTEILVRAAIVRNLCQVDGIDYVSIICHDGELMDALGQPVGKMNAEQFVDNSGNEINSYESVRLSLFFADESGDKLKKAVRTVEYNSNISMEKLVVEQLISGPNSDGFKATINPQTKLINATIKDGICYISFDETFLSMPEGVNANIMIYSIVNSLVELPNVNKVMISIDGYEITTIGEGISIDTTFERNLELVE